jgi:hypothetical protein
VIRWLQLIGQRIVRGPVPIDFVGVFGTTLPAYYSDECDRGTEITLRRSACIEDFMPLRAAEEEE